MPDELRIEITTRATRKQASTFSVAIRREHMRSNRPVNLNGCRMRVVILVIYTSAYEYGIRVYIEYCLSVHAGQRSVMRRRHDIGT